MIGPKTIAVVTGSRAEYGLLTWPMRDIAADPELDLRLIVTGSHLEAAHGMTVEQIEADGFSIDCRVPIALDDDSPAGIARSMSLCLNGMVSALERLAPDIVLLLGDRFEIFAAAQAAMLLNLPIAHIAGGDVTEGAIDDAMRHAITKLAHIHLATNAAAAARIIQMGEPPERVHVTGSPGLDHLVRGQRMGRADLEQSLGRRLGEHNLLVTFHPVTLEPDNGLAQLDALLGALAGLEPDHAIWITRPNADSGGRAIGERIDRWAQGRPNVAVYTSLGPARYLALLGEADMMIGNSSSGLYEAPSFGTPTVDIGNRQQGRLAGPSVFHCPPEEKAIRDAIDWAFAFDRSLAVNPYGDGYGSVRIVAALKAAPARGSLLTKRFHRLTVADG